LPWHKQEEQVQASNNPIGSTNVKPHTSYAARRREGYRDKTRRNGNETHAPKKPEEKPEEKEVSKVSA
jgi:hypothetical protein